MKNHTRTWGRLAVIGTIVTVGTLLTGCASSASSSSGSGSTAVTEIPIGASVEVTGGAGSIGSIWKQGIDLAIKQANGKSGFTVAGKKYKWQLTLDDNQTTTDQAIANYRSFVGNNDNFIIGPGVSTEFPPAINSLGGKQPIILTPAQGTAFIGTPAGQNLYLTHLSDTGAKGRVAQMVGLLMKKYHPKTVAILLPQDASGELYTTTYGQAFKDAGAKIVYSEAFPSTTTDFSSYVTAIKATNPSLVVSGYLDSWMQPFMNQASQAGLTSPVFVGAPGTNVTSMQDHAGITKFAYSVTTRAVDNASDPKVASYRKVYEAEYGTEPSATGFWALSYYDPILMLTQAMKDAKTVSDLSAITKSFVKIKDFGTLGETFDPTTHRAVYNAQVGFSDNGKVSYVDAGN